METFSALRVLCAENSPATGECPSQSPMTRRFDVFFNLRLNKRLSKQSWGWWSETRHFKCSTKSIFSMQQLHQPRLWFITGGYLVKRWFIPAAARARGQSNDLNRGILASNLLNCHNEVINAPPIPSTSRCIHIVYRHKNIWEYQWSNFIYNCMSTFLHCVRCKDALLDCSAPGGERCESLTWVDEISTAKSTSETYADLEQNEKKLYPIPSRQFKHIACRLGCIYMSEGWRTNYSYKKLSSPFLWNWDFEHFFK